MWILGSLPKELIFFYIPGILGICLTYFYPNLGETSIIFGLFATAIVDSGHVYTTAWRTWLNPSERKSRAGYWLAPLMIFLLFSFWYFTQLPGLWKFIVYATLYHHVRQVYGFSKWYQQLNGRYSKTSDYFLYCLLVLPIVIYHFRTGVPTNYYSESDLFVYPHPKIEAGLTLLYLIIVIGWIGFEFFRIRKGIIEVNRLISVGYPTLIYGWCFLYGKTFSQVMIPLLFIHGIAYCGVMEQTLRRTQGKKFKSIVMSSIAISVTAIIFGLGDSWVEENVIAYDFGQTLNPMGILTSCLVGIYLTPLFSHYLFDAWIWRKNHREAPETFNSSP